MADAGETPKKTCFIAMPVRTTEEHAKTFGDPDHWNHVLEELFVPAVEAAGFEAWRPISTGSDLIQAKIVRQLERADMVLVDISHNNPNVFFELGVRTSVDKPIALVRCDKSASIPFDVSGVNTHTYDPSLKSFVMEEEQEKLRQHLLAAEASCAGRNPVWEQYGLELKAIEPTADGTSQDAMLSLIATRLDDLGDQVGDLRRMTAVRRPTVVREGMAFNEPTRRPLAPVLSTKPRARADSGAISQEDRSTIAALDEHIRDVAIAHGIAMGTGYDVDLREVLMTLADRPDTETFREFRTEIKIAADRYGYTPKFRIFNDAQASNPDAL